MLQVYNIDIPASDRIAVIGAIHSDTATSEVFEATGVEPAHFSSGHTHSSSEKDLASACFLAGSGTRPAGQSMLRAPPSTHSLCATSTWTPPTPHVPPVAARPTLLPRPLIIIAIKLLRPHSFTPQHRNRLRRRCHHRRRKSLDSLAAISRRSRRPSEPLFSIKTPRSDAGIRYGKHWLQ